jgi:excisionase family DNA binding protein
MTFDDAPDVLTVTEAARLLRCSSATLYRAIREGTFPYTRVRGKIVVGKVALIAYMHR